MKNHFSKIPSVNKLLESLKKLTQKVDHFYLKSIIESIINVIKINPKKYKLDSVSREEISSVIINMVNQKIDNLLKPVLHPVINGTGIILHTGLGRAPLGNQIIQTLENVDHYTNLELNLKTGKRGQRLDHVIPLLKLLTGAQDAVVTNNNAAAVLLCLNSIAKRKEVIVSRGELVEIGGSFRMPEVMKSSGAKMVEIGATNKTHLSDYENAITDKTAAIMIVHPSNYEIKGFTDKPEIKEIVEVAHDKNVPVIYDIGSGALVDMRKYGYYYEPIISDMVKLDVDLISFSGDKLLGGPQAGLIVGKQQYVKKLRQNHLLRALRCDKITLNLLATTLQSFLHEDSLQDKNVTYGYFSRDINYLSDLGKNIITNLNYKIKSHIKLVDSEGRIGSGAYPTFPVKSKSIQLNLPGNSAEKSARKFRQQQIPILGYIESDIFHINLLAIHKKDIEPLINTLNSIL